MVRLIVLFISILCASGALYAQYKLNENFETPAFPPSGWTESDANDIISRSSVVSGYGFGTGSIKSDFFNVISGTSTLNTPVFNNLTNNDTLTFDYAYGPYTELSPDSLLIKISTDNGATFSVILAAYQLTNIATAAAGDFEFVPGAGQWATIRLKMPPAVTGNNSLIQFCFSSAFGNNLYIDNITLGITPASDVEALSIENTGTSYYTSPIITPYGKYRNNGTVPATFNVTRTISPGGYSSTKTVSGLTGGTITSVNFDPWSFSPGTPYTIKDSISFPGDGNSSNDTLRGMLIPNIAKTVLIYWNDAASKDSIALHLDASGYNNYYDILSMSEYGGSLQSWKTIFCLFGSGVTWNNALRDSLKSFLDFSTFGDQKTLCIFGNDIAYANDPVSNVSATPEDTTFLRHYLHARYLGDNWLTSIISSTATIKGVNSFSAVPSSVVTDLSPDFIRPVNTATAAFVPLSEDGSGDTATAVVFDGANYNMLFSTNLYSKFSTNTNSVFNTISQWIFDNGVLPVELANFSSEVENNSVRLNWTTLSEINNSGFDVERKSANSGWQKTGFIQGSGTTNSPHNYFYKERLNSSGVYNYRLRQTDYNGNYKYYNLNSEVNIGAPKEFALKQNYPNPFNPVTNIEYELPADSKVSVNIYDITGRLSGTLVNGIQPAGYYKIQFDAAKMNLASGVYIYQIISESSGIKNVKSLKMLLVK